MKKLMKLLIFTLFFTLLMSRGLAAEVGTEVEKMAPTFQINDLEGRTFKLSDYRGKKAVYLIFWATWCPNCKREVPQINSIQEKYQDEIELLAINTAINDSEKKVKRYREKHEINYAIAYDKGSKVTHLYNVKGVPTQIIIDVNGIIRYRGVSVPADLEKHLEMLLKRRSLEKHN